jgi:hypothetical protein
MVENKLRDMRDSLLMRLDVVERKGLERGAGEAESVGFFDVGDGFQRALAEAAILIAIAEFDGFVFTCGSAAGNGCGAVAAVGEKDFRFDRRIAARVENFDIAYSNDGGNRVSKNYRAPVPWAYSGRKLLLFQRIVEQFEVDFDPGLDVDGFARFHARFEVPLLDRINSFLIEAQPEGANDLDVSRKSVFIDHE